MDRILDHKRSPSDIEQQRVDDAASGGDRKCLDGRAEPVKMRLELLHPRRRVNPGEGHHPAVLVEPDDPKHRSATGGVRVASHPTRRLRGIRPIGLQLDTIVLDWLPFSNAIHDREYPRFNLFG